MEKPPPEETKLLKNVVVQIVPNSNESRQIAVASSKSEAVVVRQNGKDFKFKKPKVICEASHSPPSTPQIPGSSQASVTKTIDTVVKDEVPDVSEGNEDNFEEYEEEEEEEDCLRIIEETLVDVRTLPGRT